MFRYIFHAKEILTISEFYVLYTGETLWHDEFLKLSDALILKSADEKIPDNSMELVVKVVDLRYTEDNEILKRSDTLSGYSLLLSSVRENRRKGMTPEDAVDEAIDHCIREGVLLDFLQNNKEAYNMILGEGVTDEEIIAVRERDARNEGEARTAKLTELLLDANRLDDLKRSASDSEYRRQLFEEFGL